MIFHCKVLLDRTWLWRLNRFKFKWLLRIQIQVFSVHFSKIFLHKLLLLLISLIWLRFFFSLVALSFFWFRNRMRIAILPCFRASSVSPLQEYFDLRVLFNQHAFPVRARLRAGHVRFELLFDPNYSGDAGLRLRVLFGMFCVFRQRPVLFVPARGLRADVLGQVERVLVWGRRAYFPR